MDTGAQLAGQTVELLQSLIRNRCVNDGSPESGHETRNVELLSSFFEGAGIALQPYESLPGRGSVVARIEGSDPSAKSVCLMGHLDVVPVNASGWSQDPFGGELIDGEVWGRGAVDMLNLTSSMAVAFRHLAKSGFKPKGTLIFLGVADEEAGGLLGAKWLLDNEYEAVKADYVLTEFGGLLQSRGDRPVVSIAVGEKGPSWRRLTVRGEPGHGSMPFGSDNAVVKAAEVVRRLSDYRPRAMMHDLWERQVASMNLPDELRDQLLDPERAMDIIGALPPGAARYFHACTHTTFSPNVAMGGSKVNVVPDEVRIELDMRTLPGETSEHVEAHLREALGDLYDQIEMEIIVEDAATRSPFDTPMWKVLQEAVQQEHPGAVLLPSLMTGCTDARFYRQKGSVAYGAGLFSKELDTAQFGARFHGHDERIDIRSLDLATQLWLQVAERMLLDPPG